MTNQCGAALEIQFAEEANLPEMDIHFALLAGFFARPGRIDSILPSRGETSCPGRDRCLDNTEQRRDLSSPLSSREEKSASRGLLLVGNISRRRDLTARKQPGYGEQTVVRFICERGVEFVS